VYVVNVILSALLVLSWRETLFLVGESILRKFARFSPPEGFPRVNLVYVVNVILPVILYMQLLC
jgi:hypothetical protein